MTRYSFAYQNFKKRLGEVETLLRRAKCLEKQSVRGTQPLAYVAEINALCRGCVVMLSGHVEGYIKDLGDIAIDRIYDRRVDRSKIPKKFFYFISKEHFDNIKDTSDVTSLSENMFVFLQGDAMYWRESGPFVARIPTDKFQKGFANPSSKKISKYFSRFGFRGYRNEMNRILKSQAQPTFNMLDNIVTARNGIAHGDLNVIRTPLDVSEMVDVMKVFCRTTDQVFGAWCSQNLCSIR